MATTCYDCVQTYPPSGIWWWLGIGAALYLVCLGRVIWGRPQWANGAGGLGMMCGFLGFLPVMVMMPFDSLDTAWWWLILVALGLSFVAMIPLTIGNRRYWNWKNAQKEKTAEARADEAEALLRRLGA